MAIKTTDWISPGNRQNLSKLIKQIMFFYHFMAGKTAFEVFIGYIHSVDILNTLRQRQNGRHFADGTFKYISLKENVRILIKISLKFVAKSPIDSIPALFQIMAWRRPGDKPLSEAMMVSLLTHIYVARPQWVKQKNLLHIVHLNQGFLIPLIF